MSKITKSAKGQECQIRIPTICNGDPRTVVLCHLPGGGMGAKEEDQYAAYGCSACHGVVDGASWEGQCWPSDTLKLWHLEAVIRTQKIMFEKGLIKI